MDVESVLLLLREVIGTRVEAKAYRLIKEMPDYWVWEIETQRPSLHLIVKLAGPGAEYTSAFEQTAALHRLVRAQTAIPLPEVIAANGQYQKWPWRYFIKTYLPGMEWAEAARHTPADGLRLARAQLGAAVAEMHQIHFTGFGELDDQAGVPQPLPYPDALAQRVRKMIIPREAQEYVLSMLADRSGLLQDRQQPALCHEDLHHYNILLKKEAGTWHLAGILDFEKAWAGEAAIDLARMDLWKMTGKAFWDAYQERCPLDEGYRERQAIYQLIWCVEYAEDSPAHLATTRELCEALGLPVIESFIPFRVKI